VSISSAADVSQIFFMWRSSRALVDGNLRTSA
jgi:hypothetical protein